MAAKAAAIAVMNNNELDNSEDNSYKNYSIVIHKLSYITCYCGYVTSGFHNCEVEKGKLTFDYCYEDLCKLCEEQLRVSYQDRDGYIRCTNCDEKITSINDICQECYCFSCNLFKRDCFCCNTCGNYNGSQCICYDSDIESNEQSENDGEQQQQQQVANATISKTEKNQFNVCSI